MPNSHSTLEIPRTKKKPKLNIMSELVPGLSSGVALAASLSVSGSAGLSIRLHTLDLQWPAAAFLFVM